MPADSKAQRRLMAIAEHHPDEVNEENRGVLKMNHKQLHDFSSTKEKDLPEHVKKHGEHGEAGGEDHKAAVSKMHPEHVHNLVKHAAAGKFGPEAQQMAQQAQQAPPRGDGDADDQPQSGGRDMSSIFGGGGSAPAPAAPAPASRASMFAGRGGF